MATRTRSVYARLLCVAALLAVPAGAHAERVDITDPTLLGDVVFRADLGQSEYEESQVNEVRFANGLYSYIYAIQSGRYFPDGDTDPSLVSYSIAGHPLEDTWGAIRSSDEFWRHEYAVNPTAAVSRIDRIHDGFIVIPTGAFEGQFTVVYVQSPLHPVLRGILTYTAYNVEVDYDTGERTRIYDSYSKPGFVVPTPEPGSVILFASGLAAIVMSRRRRRHP
jgi:hypothetical protein